MSFTEFWDLAKGWRERFSNPRKGRGGAEPAWDRVIKEGADPEEIIAGAKGYLEHIRQDDIEPRHVCMAATFLNQWRWEQYVELAREAEEQADQDLLERRRTYYRSGWQDECRGDPEPKRECKLPPEVQEAYEQGRREAREKPKLQVVK